MKKQNGITLVALVVTNVRSARRAGTTATYDQLKKYFEINRMPKENRT